MGTYIHVGIKTKEGHKAHFPYTRDLDDDEFVSRFLHYANAICALKGWGIITRADLVVFNELYDAWAAHGRDVKPRDLGLDGWEFQELGSARWRAWTNHTLYHFEGCLFKRGHSKYEGVQWYEDFIERGYTEVKIIMAKLLIDGWGLGATPLDVVPILNYIDSVSAG